MIIEVAPALKREAKNKKAHNGYHRGGPLF
jgi:hypothetical protein